MTATGGDGVERGYGGSGGIIILDGNFDQLTHNYLAYGGLAGSQAVDSTGCGVGAAGTIFFKHQDLLFVSNHNRKTDKVTVVHAKPRADSAYPNENLVAKTVWIEGGANVNITNSSMSSIMFP